MRNLDACGRVSKWSDLEEILHVRSVRIAHKSRVRKISLALGGHLGEDVTLERVLPLDLSGTSDAESLLCTGIGLNLWHDAF